MARLTENDISNMRLSLQFGGRGAGIKSITRGEVADLFDELEECWAGNLPDWVNDRFGYEDDGAEWVPAWHIARIESAVDACVEMAKLFPVYAVAYDALAEHLSELLEDLDDGDCITEEKEVRRCDAANVLCREAGNRPCLSRPDPV